MIDAAVTAPNERIYFFSGDQYMRYNFDKGRVDRGYPKPISTWDGLWHEDIDAAVPGQGDRAHKLYFFKGSQYMRYDTDKGRVDTGYPKPISGAWRGLWDRDIDAAVTAPNNKMYFFRNDEYIRYDFGAGRADSGYPRLTDNWDGLWSRNIDAAVPGQGNRKGKLYFFRNHDYIRWQTGQGGGVDRSYPRPIGLNWQGIKFEPFRPGRHGFDFVNSFERIPKLPDKNLLGNLANEITDDISVGYGLCGGMSLAARDFYLCGRSMPGGSRPPQSGRLFDYLWKRQLDTFDDGYRLLRRFVHFYMPTTFTREQSVDEVKKARRIVERGIPVVLGLVYVRAAKGLIWDNHQVLAYHCRRDDDMTIFTVYDPNEPGDNAVQVFANEKRGHHLRPNKLWMDMKQVFHREQRSKEVIGLICMDVPSIEPPNNL